MAASAAEWSGAPGRCMTSSACAAIADHTGETGCGSGAVCCIDTPDVADNPPVPTGDELMMQAQVTTEMTNWAVMILHDPVTYPMFSTAMKTSRLRHDVGAERLRHLAVGELVRRDLYRRGLHLPMQ